MNTYLISYDLRIPETSQDYERLIDYIESYSSWAKPLKSVWFISTLKTVSDVRDELKKKTDGNDGILVLDVTNNSWGTAGIDQDVTDWMKKNL